MEIFRGGRLSARIGSNAASTPPRLSLYLFAPSCPPICRSLSCPLAAVEPHAATVASFLHPSWPCRLIPQFAQCLRSLFSNLALTGCVAAAGHRRYPFWLRLGTGAGASQVVSRWAKGHPQVRPVLVVLARHQLLTQIVRIDRPRSLPLCYKHMFNCCRCFRGMLQVFRIDVVKIDQDIAYVAMAIRVCFKHLF
jgi:hypothetical protein